MEPDKIDPRFIVDLRGKRWPTFAGVLDAATAAGLKSLTTHVLQIPSKENGNLAVVEATAQFDGGRTFVDVGDASPASTSQQMACALVRLASTRAKGRALRDALNIGEALLEEALPDSEEPRGSAPRGDYRPAPAAPVGQTRPAFESAHRAPLQESSGDERAALLKQYAATQKRARELSIKFLVVPTLKASNVEIAEATLALRAEIQDLEAKIAARPAV